MPRPKTNPTQRIRAFDLYKLKLGPAAIQKQLVEDFSAEEAVGLRTVNTSPPAEVTVRSASGIRWIEQLW